MKVKGKDETFADSSLVIRAILSIKIKMACEATVADSKAVNVLCKILNHCRVGNILKILFSLQMSYIGKESLY